MGIIAEALLALPAKFMDPFFLEFVFSFVIVESVSFFASAFMFFLNKYLNNQPTDTALYAPVLTLILSMGLLLLWFTSLMLLSTFLLQST